MRIISGKARGRNIETLDVAHLRPMLDRVRENLFNIIQFDVEGARILDLFSGCGSLGIEALSRGAESCVFVESDSQLVQLIEKNLRQCELKERAYVLRDDVFMLPGRLPPRGYDAAEIVLADPPYEHIDNPNERDSVFDALEGMIGGMIAPGALLMLHHGPMPHALWPTGKMKCIDRRVYGNSQLTFFRVKGEKE
ncbi:MAG: 16S rRNA (guanine(966)-N(2))-methyltransferase RsmD [Planctomycetota bacterium]